MPIKPTTKHHMTKQDAVYTSILLTVALCIGIYLIATAVVIAKDGVTFIEFGRNLEIAPTETMIQEDQHPGYPAIIMEIHKITKFVNKNESLLNLIYSAQIASLTFRLFTLVLLYFIGKALVGAKFSFWSVLILILLPKPAEYGSDALSDWLHMFFLAAGMWMLIRGAIDAKWWMFALAGTAAGFGYLIRPECTQIIIYGLLWLGLQLFRAKRPLTRTKVLLAAVLLFVGFIIPAGPYMRLKGAIFPKKGIGNLALNLSADNTEQTYSPVVSKTTYTASVIPSDIAKALGELFENIGDALMWFFLLPLSIGAFLYFKERDLLQPKKFFITVLIALNIPLMVWLYCRHGYISGRHILPLLVFTIFFIPAGIQKLAFWLESKFSNGNSQKNLWFTILLIAGIAICAPKLLRPLHYDKFIYREASRWLAENTEKNALIAVPDIRISFYAERKGLKYDTITAPNVVQYVVSEMQSEELRPPIEPLIVFEDKDNKRKLAIFKNSVFTE